MFDTVLETPSLLHLQPGEMTDWNDWLRFEFLCHMYPIIKALLRCYGVPAVCLSICVGLRNCCTSKPHSNTHLHTHTPCTHIFFLSHTHTQRNLCLLTHEGVYVCVSAGEQGDKISGMETHSHNAQICNTMVHKGDKCILQTAYNQGNVDKTILYMLVLVQTLLHSLITYNLQMIYWSK